MSSNTTEAEPDSDRDIARILEAAGSREAPSEAQRDRWETHFRAELAEARRLRRRRRLLPAAAVAASLVALAVLLQQAPDRDVTVQARIMNVAGTVEIIAESERRIAISPGLKIADGSLLETGAESRLGLDWAGFDVRLNEDTQLRLIGKQLELQRGEIYVSSLHQITSLDVVTVVTPLATVRDIGTQFRVHLDGDTLTASVREGSIEVETADSKQRVDAGLGKVLALRVTRDGIVEPQIDNTDWRWIHEIAPPFELEGRSVLAFLKWAAAESGRELRFKDSAVQLSAGQIRISGAMDLQDLDPEQVIALVLSTTRFEATVLDDEIQVDRRQSE